MKREVFLVFIIVFFINLVFVYAQTCEDPSKGGIRVKDICYTCGDSDGICPEDFGAVCHVCDPDPDKDGGDCGPCPVYEDPTAPECEIIYAKWTNVGGNVINSVKEGTKVYLKVSTSNCIGKSLSFIVKEDDGLLGSQDVFTNPISITVDKDVVSGEWFAEWQDDQSGDPEYYFIASIGSESMTSSTPHLEVSKKDVPPGDVECVSGKGPGDVCVTDKDCAGTYNTECVCNDNDNDNCPEVDCTTTGDSCDIGGCPGEINNDCDCWDIPGDDCPIVTDCDVGGYCKTLNGCEGNYNAECSCVDKIGDDCPEAVCTTVGDSCKTDEKCDGRYNSECACIDVFNDDGCPTSITDPDDTDGDGLPDLWEQIYCKDEDCDPYADPDHDGLNNFEEFQWKTDPQNPDTDGDEILDGVEVLYGFDPTIGDYPEGENLDIDEDGILDDWELEYCGEDCDPSELEPIDCGGDCDPNSDPDGDGLTNYDEFLYDTDPLVADLGNAYIYCPAGSTFVGWDEFGWAMCSDVAGSNDQTGLDCPGVSWICGECIEGEVDCICDEDRTIATKIPCEDDDVGVGYQEPVQPFPIFTWFNLIITSLILAGFYVFIHKKR